MSGVHVVSGIVAGLPSVSARRMALIGRQNPYFTLAYHTFPSVSAIDKSTAANIRALSLMSR